MRRDSTTLTIEKLGTKSEEPLLGSQIAAPVSQACSPLQGLSGSRFSPARCACSIPAVLTSLMPLCGLRHPPCCTGAAEGLCLSGLENLMKLSFPNISWVIWSRAQPRWKLEAGLKLWSLSYQSDFLSCLPPVYWLLKWRRCSFFHLILSATGWSSFTLQNTHDYPEDLKKKDLTRNWRMLWWSFPVFFLFFFWLEIW